MCHETLIYGAEYFLTPYTYNKKTKFFEIFVNGGFKNVYYLTLFTFKQEPTEVQDAAKKPNFEFLQLTKAFQTILPNEV